VTATEAERNRRRGLTPWWRARSWSKDLDTLIRLRKGLRALDGDPDAEQAPLSAPALLPAPIELLAPPQDGVTQHDGPESPLIPDQGPSPAAPYSQETDLPTDASGQEAPVQEMTARQLLSPEVRPPQISPDIPSAQATPEVRPPQALAPEPEHGEPGPGQQPDTVPTDAREAFTSEAEQAWTQVYAAGSSLMIKAAEEDAAASPASWTAEVVKVDHRTDDIAVLTIAPDQPLPFTAGQHLTVQTPRWPRVWRPYSIACMPRDDGLLALHVKAVPGGWVSNALVRYTSSGSELVLGPPLGTMTLERAAGRDLLCVAGGTGLSPVKAIIEQAVRESSATPRRIYLYYGARRRHEL
jgi:NAD(P)H-flavin reductase